MTDIQENLLELLLEIDDICKKYDITYYLVGGSALGAVRHKGFLPWDDDADVVMTKDNWINFQKAFAKEKPENRELVGWDQYKEEPSIFFRYVDVTRTYIHQSLWDQYMPWGRIVDIFVLNPLPEDNTKWDKYHRNMQRFGEFLMDSHIVMNNNTPMQWFFFDKLVGKFKGRINYAYHLNSKISKYAEEKCSYYSYSYPRVHVIYHKDIFKKPRYINYENHMLPIPTQAEEHLRILYGDEWYIIPEKNNQIVHIAIRSDEHSYFEYYNDFSHYANIPQVKKKNRQTKILKMIRNKIQLKREKYICKIRKDYLSRMFDNYWKNNGEKLISLRNNKQWNNIYNSFLPYYKEQLMNQMVNSEMSIVIPKEMQEMALYALVYRGNSRKAQKIINLHNNASEYIGITNLIDEKTDLFLTYEKEDFENAKIKAEKLYKEHPFDKDIAAIYFNFILQEEMDLDYAKKIHTEIQKLMHMWEESDEFKALYAISCEKTGDYLEKEQIIKSLYLNSRHGLIRLWLENQNITVVCEQEANEIE